MVANVKKKKKIQNGWDLMLTPNLSLGDRPFFYGLVGMWTQMSAMATSA